MLSKELREVFWPKTFENRVELFYDKTSEGRTKNKETCFPNIREKDVCAV